MTRPLRILMGVHHIFAGDQRSPLQALRGCGAVSRREQAPALQGGAVRYHTRGRIATSALRPPRNDSIACRISHHFGLVVGAGSPRPRGGRCVFAGDRKGRPYGLLGGGGAYTLRPIAKPAEAGLRPAVLLHSDGKLFIGMPRLQGGADGAPHGTRPAYQVIPGTLGNSSTSTSTTTILSRMMRIACSLSSFSATFSAPPRRTRAFSAEVCIWMA